MMKLITEELLDTVTSRAKENSRLRMNYNFHASMDAPIHRLLNALEPGTYLPPHRHTDKEETYLVLRGSLLAFWSFNIFPDKPIRKPPDIFYCIPGGFFMYHVISQTGS